MTEQHYDIQRYDMTQDAMTPESVVRQVNLIQHVMESVMKLDEHFGTIPGTKKPSLYKAGAEKLSLTFRLAPSYEVKEKDMHGGHREYYVKCTLTHIPTDKVFGQGVGACSTMEGKFRFRSGDGEFIGQSVPQAYWKDRDVSLIGGKGFAVRKNPDHGNKYEIVRLGEKVEHDNPADYYNTVLKMAKKRAHVDAVLTATAASDIFTQDVEDMPEVIPPKPEKITTPDVHEGYSPGNDVNDEMVMSKDTSEVEKGQEGASSQAEKPPFEEIITKITDVKKKEGKTKDDKPYTRFEVWVGKDMYSTFSESIAKIAKVAKEADKEAKIYFEVSGKFKNLKEIVITEE
jgi:hypothetical protein